MPKGKGYPQGGGKKSGSKKPGQMKATTHKVRYGMPKTGRGKTA